jgi:hypothetical protein
MKPHIMRRSDFIRDKGIVAESELGVFVVREGNEYQLGVAMDVDTVVYLDKTTDNNQIKMMLDNAVYEIETIRERFGYCFPEDGAAK